MIGLVLLYFVGKAFYDLAGINNKSEWLYAILGVGSYYAGLLIGGILIAIGYELFVGSVDEVNDTLLSILALPIGVLACWGFYRLLKSRWEKSQTFSASAEEVLDAHLIDKDTDRR
jgi:hypothetical protein